MFFVIEILLTIWAWTRGWKSYSLIPLGAAMGIGFLCGLVGLYSEEMLPFFALLDIAAVVALIIMIIKKKEEADT
jgi:tetrahydromethanopterin S-methyltransferase subunit C